MSRKILPVKYPFAIVILTLIILGISRFLLLFFDTASTTVICLFLGMYLGKHADRIILKIFGRKI